MSDILFPALIEPLASAPAASRDGTSMAAILVREDATDERGDLSPHDRVTCPVHRRWVHQCVSSPAHAIRVSGHRWCRECDAAVIVAVDELAGSITLTCPECRRSPSSAANRQLLRSCRASIDAARRDRSPTLPIPSEGSRMNTTTTMTPIATPDLHGLIEHALRDLKRARFSNDGTGIVCSERRMNALLDQLAKRLRTRRFS